MVTARIRTRCAMAQIILQRYGARTQACPYYLWVHVTSSKVFAIFVGSPCLPSASHSKWFFNIDDEAVRLPRAVFGLPLVESAFWHQTASG